MQVVVVVAVAAALCALATTGEALKVFVAGGTGRLGQRVVKQLVKQGDEVVVGAREASLGKAAGLFDSEPRASVVGVDLDDYSSILSALKGCDSVVCALGALESEALNPQNPYRVDGRMTTNLIRVARDAPSGSRCKHFVLVTSLGTGKFGMPAAILNLFWGVLLFKRQSELELEKGKDSMPFTIIRPGGMERPTDDFEKTHNAQVFPADSTFGGLISRLQVAKLAAAAIANPVLSKNKVYEIVASEDAPQKDYRTLMEEFNS